MNPQASQLRDPSSQCMLSFGNHDVSPGRNRSLYSPLPMQVPLKPSCFSKAIHFPFLRNQEFEDNAPPGSSSHPTPSILLLVRLTTQPLSLPRSQKTPFPTTVKILRYIVCKCLTPCQEIPRHVDDLTFIYESKQSHEDVGNGVCRSRVVEFLSFVRILNSSVSAEGLL